MKYLQLLIPLTFSISFCTAQNKEFNQIVKANLNHEQVLIIDSFNQELNSFGLNEENLFRNLSTAHYIYIDKGKIKSAMKDIKNNMLFEKWVQKYPEAIIDTNLLVIKQQSLNHKNKTVTNYTNFAKKDKYIHNITTTRGSAMSSQINKGTWVFNYIPKNEFSEEFLIAFYFTSDFGLGALTNKYPQVIAYTKSLQNRGEVFINKYNQKPNINKILLFLGKFIDVCASLFISYNNPDLLKFTLTNIIVPKMTKPVISSTF